MSCNRFFATVLSALAITRHRTRPDLRRADEPVRGLAPPRNASAVRPIPAMDRHLVQPSPDYYVATFHRERRPLSGFFQLAERFSRPRVRAAALLRRIRFEPLRTGVTGPGVAEQILDGLTLASTSS